MKTTLKVVAALAVIALCSSVSVQAQNQKWGHIKMDELIPSMAEYDSARVQLERFGLSLEKEIDFMTVELNKMQEDLEKNKANLNDLVRHSREQDLMLRYQRLQSFQQDAQERYQMESEKLLQPVFEKATKAIEAVAKEQGITYVINDNPQLLFYKGTGSIDLLPAVKAHLGIKK